MTLSPLYRPTDFIIWYSKKGFFPCKLDYFAEVDSLLRDTSIRRNLVLAPALFRSFYCNYMYALHNVDTSLRQATDTSETVNRLLGSALHVCGEKYLKTEI